MLGNLCRVSAVLHQPLRQLKGMSVRGRIAERTRIRKHRRIKAGSNLWSDLHARSLAQAVNHLRAGAGGRINPVEVGKGFGSYVMIDADKEIIFQPLNPCSLQAIALEQDGRVIVAVYVGGVNDRVRTGQRLIDY